MDGSIIGNLLNPVVQQVKSNVSVPSALFEEQLDYVIKRLVLREGYSDTDASIARNEFLRFMSLVYVAEDVDLAPPKLVDEFWHTFILFTKKYHAFCATHFGHYVHHEPQESYDYASSRVSKAISNTMKFLAETYDSYDASVWGSFGICSGHDSIAPSESKRRNRS